MMYLKNTALAEAKRDLARFIQQSAGGAAQ